MVPPAPQEATGFLVACALKLAEGLSAPGAIFRYNPGPFMIHRFRGRP